jgi:hypothetical protein
MFTFRLLLPSNTASAALDVVELQTLCIYLFSQVEKPFSLLCLAGRQPGELQVGTVLSALAENHCVSKITGPPNAACFSHSKKNAMDAISVGYTTSLSLA